MGTEQMKQDVFPWAARKCSNNAIEIMLDLSPRAIRERRQEHSFSFWQLRTPLTRNVIEGVFPYGLDNGCFSGSLHPAWDRLLEEAREVRPVFVCCPDVVGHAGLTLSLFDHFERKTNGLPRALVLQDGIGNLADRIPWSKIHAVFVGGSDDFKLSSEAFQVAQCARMLGKWVHVGRVNEAKRVVAWLGKADSIDGSGISRDPRRTQLAEVVETIRGHPRQRQMEI